MLTCYSAHNLSAQDRWDGGGGMGSLGGIIDRPPLPIFRTNNMPHAPWSDPSSSLTEAHLPSSPPAAKEQLGMLPLPAVSNSLRHWPAEGWTNSTLTSGRLFIVVGWNDQETSREKNIIPYYNFIILVLGHGNNFVLMCIFQIHLSMTYSSQQAVQIIIWCSASMLLHCCLLPEI